MNGNQHKENKSNKCNKKMFLCPLIFTALFNFFSWIGTKLNPVIDIKENNWTGLKWLYTCLLSYLSVLLYSMLPSSTAHSPFLVMYPFLSEVFVPIAIWICLVYCSLGHPFFILLFGSISKFLPQNNYMISHFLIDHQSL